ncbi:MAG: adenosine deaminase [Gammaproteobacteria bacterium]|nr:adenosine deaminase [Gammaproteobacteria bacterium]
MTGSKSIPKVELHCHLEACFRVRTAREIGRSLGLDVPEDPERFRREWLITEPVDNLEQALKKFANIQKLWGSEETIERLTYEACEYGVEQNIRILELRYSPDFIRGANPRLSFEKIHEAVVRGITRAKDLDIAVGLIGIVQKTLSPEDAARTTGFIIGNRESFAGIDMADMDIGFGIRRFAPLMEKAKQAGLHVTLHSGEENVPEAPQHVRVAVEELGAERIGHGIYIHRDPEVMDVVKRNNVLLELCPTSNLLTNSVPSISEHPLRRLMEAGVMVSINSDDPHLFGIDLCHEYDVVHSELGLTVEDFERINDDAAASSFLPQEERQRVWPREIRESPAG